MKFLQIFTKIPNYKKFGYTPRHYDPKEEERKERELRIQKELMSEEEQQEVGRGRCTMVIVHGLLDRSRLQKKPLHHKLIRLLRC